MYRAPEHGKARSACQQQGVMRAFPAAIRNFAETFVDLQGARHEADYALEGQYLKPDVLAIIDTAEDAINEFEQADVRRRRSFAVHVLFKQRRCDRPATTTRWRSRSRCSPSPPSRPARRRSLRRRP